MSIEEELPYLLEELANDHIVGERPLLKPGSAERDPVRPAWWTIAAIAACSAVLVGGLVAIRFINNDQGPVASPPTASTASTASTTSQTPSSEPSAPVADVAALPSLDLIRFDARSTAEGTTGVVLVFDGDLPETDVLHAENIASPPSDRISYATQFSLDSPVSVCGSTHWFPSPGNRIVDVYVPSSWFGPAAAIDPPTTWSPDGATPSKIIVCEPLNETVQISIWGSASARLDDIGLSVGDHTITVFIDPDPDPAEGPAETIDNEALASPLVAITGDGDAVYFPNDETTPVLIYDGPNTVDRVVYGAAENRFVVSLCCSPVVGQIVSAPSDELPMSADISPPKDQMGEPELVFDGYGSAPAIDPAGDRQASIVGEGRGLWVTDAASDTFANIRLPDEAGGLWDLLWNESGIIILGRTEFTWTLTTANYNEGNIVLGATRDFATLSNFDDLRFAGAAVDGEVAVHEQGTDTVLSGQIDDYGNNNGAETGSSLQVIKLPAAALSAWFHDPEQLIWVDTDRALRVGDRVIPGDYTWARR